jgi:quercetin dioxygenase-like cupin family protein
MIQRNVPFDFHGATMVVLALTEDTGGDYSVLSADHLPERGPALHVHPHGAETFVILEGSYTFYRGDEIVHGAVGDAVSIPAGVPHRFVAGPDGGKVIIISPPDLDRYFWNVGVATAQGELSFVDESAVAAEHGQAFLDSGAHWEVIVGGCGLSGFTVTVALWPD